MQAMSLSAMVQTRFWRWCLPAFMKERPLLAHDSYSFYPVYAETFGVHMVKIPLSDDFRLILTLIVNLLRNYYR